MRDDDTLEGKTYDILTEDLVEEKGQTPRRDFDSKRLIIKMLDGTTITGRTNLRSNTRLSDLLNKEKDLFLVIFDAPFRGQDGQVVFVNKTQIMWVMPVDD